MSTAITNGADVAAELTRAIRDDLVEHRRTPTPHDSVWASSSRACLRRMVLDLTVPDQQLPPDADLLAKFEHGNAREADILATLTKLGRHGDLPFRITRQQERFVLRDRKARPAIVGRVDAFIEIGSVRAPIEIKSWSPYVVDRLERFEDLYASPWTAGGAAQILAYLLGAGVPYGLLVLDTRAIPKILHVDLDPNLEYIETFLARAETALDHADAGTLPDYHDDPDECLRCPFFGATCNPPLIAKDTLAVLDDPELEGALERREELRKPGKAFSELDDEIKHRLRGVTHAVIGKFEIRGAWGKQSRIDLPRDVKEKYTRVDPHGRFTLHIVKHG
jgi:hypothetical protein